MNIVKGVLQQPDLFSLLLELNWELRLSYACSVFDDFVLQSIGSDE